MVVTLVLGVLLTPGSGAGQAPAPPAPPVLDPNLSPLAPANAPALRAHLVATFDALYMERLQTQQGHPLTENMAFYYLRQELQALIDMWRATGNPVYVRQASLRAGQAITEARKNLRPLLYRGQERGRWPCFQCDQVEAVTGGHSQLVDFQGATGLLMVARVLAEAGLAGGPLIGTFVEESIVGKWVQYRPAVGLPELRGPAGHRYLLSLLDSGRDKREHFAVLCMDLQHLGARGLPYGVFATLLTHLYAGRRTDPNAPAPYADELGPTVPPDWGLHVRPETGGLVWYYSPARGQPLQVMDTSHGNRTVWLALRGVQEGLLPPDSAADLVHTLRTQIWQPAQGPFYFTNLVDGSDTPVQGLGPGRKGNLWFGWHRLAAYDPGLRDLFVSLAYDLSNGGPNLPERCQNRAMIEARLCYLAWAARLLAPDGKPQIFP